MRESDYALELLENQAFLNVIRRLDEDLVERWRQAETTSAREELFQKQKMLNEIVAELHEIILQQAEKERKEGESDGIFRTFLTKFNLNHWRRKDV